MISMEICDDVVCDFCVRAVWQLTFRFMNLVLVGNTETCNKIIAQQN